MYRIARIQPGQGQILRAIRLESIHHNNTAFAISQTQLLDVSHDQWEQMCSANMHGQRPAIFLAWADHTVIGIVGCAIDASPKLQHVGQVWGMYVNPQHRKNAIGKQLLNAILVHGASICVRMLKLSVTTTQHAAIELYRNAGFQRYAYEPALLHSHGVDIDALHMRYIYTESDQ